MVILGDSLPTVSGKVDSYEDGSVQILAPWDSSDLTRLFAVVPWIHAFDGKCRDRAVTFYRGDARVPLWV